MPLVGEANRRLINQGALSTKYLALSVTVDTTIEVGAITGVPQDPTITEKQDPSEETRLIVYGASASRSFGAVKLVPFDQCHDQQVDGYLLQDGDQLDPSELRSRHPQDSIALIRMTFEHVPTDCHVYDLVVAPNISDGMLAKLIQELLVVRRMPTAAGNANRISVYEAYHQQDHEHRVSTLLGQPVACFRIMVQILSQLHVGYAISAMVEPLLIKGIDAGSPAALYCLVVAVSQTIVFVYQLLSLQRSKLSAMRADIRQECFKPRVHLVAFENGVIFDGFYMLSYFVLSSGIGIGMYQGLAGVLNLFTWYLESFLRHHAIPLSQSPPSMSEHFQTWLLSAKTHWLSVVCALGIMLLSSGPVIHDDSSVSTPNVLMLCIKAFSLAVIRVRYAQVSREEAILEPATILISTAYRVCAACIGLVVLSSTIGCRWSSLNLGLTFTLIVSQVVRTLQRYALYRRVGATNARIVNQTARAGTLLLSRFFFRAEAQIVYWAVMLQTAGLLFANLDVQHPTTVTEHNSRASTMFTSRMHSQHVQLTLLRRLIGVLDVMSTTGAHMRIVDVTKRLKTIHSLRQKLLNGAKASCFDTLRVRLVVSDGFNQASLDELEEALGVEGFTVLRVKNHHKTTDPFGYKDLQLVLWSTADDMPIEVQLHTQATRALSIQVHLFYSIMKDPMVSAWDRGKVAALLAQSLTYSKKELGMIQITEKAIPLQIKDEDAFSEQIDGFGETCVTPNRVSVDYSFIDISPKSNSSSGLKLDKF